MSQHDDQTNVLFIQQFLVQLKREHPRKAKIFELKYEGVTAPEIAMLLNLSASTVKTDWKKTKELLRQYMENGLVSPLSNASFRNRTEMESKRVSVTNLPLMKSSDYVPVNPNNVRSQRTKTPWNEVAENSVLGLDILRGAIEPAYRDTLVKMINDNVRWEQDSSRWRQCYGYKYDYTHDVLFREGDASLSPWVLELAKFAHDRKWTDKVAEQITVQKYGCGSSISSHVDSRKCFPGEILTISLVYSATYRMSDARNRVRFTTVLEPGDVVVLRDDARNLWKHEILKCKPAHNENAASWHRLSITLRNVDPQRVRP